MPTTTARSHVQQQLDELDLPAPPVDNHLIEGLHVGNNQLLHQLPRCSRHRPTHQPQTTSGPISLHDAAPLLCTNCLSIRPAASSPTPATSSICDDSTSFRILRQHAITAQRWMSLRTTTHQLADTTHTTTHTAADLHHKFNELLAELAQQYVPDPAHTKTDEAARHFRAIHQQLAAAVERHLHPTLDTIRKTLHSRTDHQLHLQTLVADNLQPNSHHTCRHQRDRHRHDLQQLADLVETNQLQEFHQQLVVTFSRTLQTTDNLQQHTNNFVDIHTRYTADPTNPDPTPDKADLRVLQTLATRWLNHTRTTVADTAGLPPRLLLTTAPADHTRILLHRPVQDLLADLTFAIVHPLEADWADSRGAVDCGPAADRLLHLPADNQREILTTAAATYTFQHNTPVQLTVPRHIEAITASLT